MMTRTLVNTGPFDDVAREMDRLLETVAAAPRFPAATGRPRAAFPPLNLWEDEGHVYVEAELPGLSLSDVELTCHGEELTIKGRREPKSYENAVVRRRERGFGAFERTIALPVEIDLDHIEATLRDGVLTITLPKTPHARPRRIEVKAQSNGH